MCGNGSNEKFLAELGEKLTGCKGVDAALADILIAYVLQAETAVDAVELAKASIHKLAKDRAFLPRKEVHGG